MPEPTQGLSFQADAIINSLRQSVLILAADLRVRLANRAFYQSFQVSPDETEGRLIYELGNGQWDIPELRRLLEDILPGNSAIHDFEIVHEFPAIGLKVMLLDAQAVFREGNHPESILLAIEDITARRQAEHSSAVQQNWMGVTLYSIGDGVITTDVDGNVSFLNPVAESLTGWAAADAKDLPLESVFHIVNETSRQPVENPVSKVLRTGTVVGLANHTLLIQRDGNELSIDDSAAPIRDLDGTVIGVVLVFRDITQRRKAERESAEQIRLTALRADANSAFSGTEKMQVGLQQCAEALVRNVNAAFARIWTLNDEADVLELQASAGLYTHLDGPHSRVKVGQFKIGRIAENRLAHLTNDVQHDPYISDPSWAAREGMVAFAGYPLIVEDRVVGVVALFSRLALSETILTDLASLSAVVASYIDRKMGEARLREREERLAVALTAAEMGTWRADLSTNHGVRDRNLNRILGLGEVVTHLPIDDCFSRVHPDDRQRMVDAFARAIRERVLYEAEVRILRPDGGVRWIREKGKPFGDHGDGPSYITGVTVDITAERHLQEKLRELAATLSESNRRKDEFLATLAHELRNPLAPMSHAIQILQFAPTVSDDASQARQIIERQLKQMVRLIDDLLEISRINQGKIQLRREWTTLASALENAVESSRPLIESAGHELTIAPFKGAIYLDADPTRLTQIFLNLLNNAAKYTERGGRILVTTEFENAHAVVSVKDTGIGISREMLPKVFDLFTQIDRSLEKSQGGLGIGLSLVKRLVELHGGTVQAQSEGRPGRGSTFVIRLPATLGRPETPVHANNRTTATQQSHKRRILIADDNKDSADTLSLLLNLMGNETQIAYDGLSALECASAFQPDVALLDIGMPKLNGFEVARRLREQSGGKALLLIALTGWGQENDLRRSHDAGFDHHLVKPVDHEQLTKLLAQLDSKKPAAH